MGYYRQEELRKAYPDLILENCSGGGHIKDFGVIQRTHYTVTTDTLSNLPDRQSLYDSTFAMPPILLQAYTYEWEYKVPGDDPEPYLWRKRHDGRWQIDPTRTARTPHQKEMARRHAEIYKQWVRPCFVMHRCTTSCRGRMASTGRHVLLESFSLARYLVYFQAGCPGTGSHCTPEGP